MSTISDQIIVSDSFTVLLDDSSEENQSLREQLRQRDEENAEKSSKSFQRKWTLCVNLSPRATRAGNKIKER